MAALKYLVIGVLLLTTVVIGAGFMLPDTAHLERSIVVNAKPNTVFTVLNSYRLFNQWSPWADLDPRTTYEFSGPESGVGARQAWSSQSPDVGSGSQEIIESVPDRLVRQKLVFNDFDTENTATQTLTPEGDGTRIVWSYDTQFGGSLLLRYFGLILDGMLGPDYERGLQKLKTLVERLPMTDSSALSVEPTEAPAIPSNPSVTP